MKFKGSVSRIEAMLDTQREETQFISSWQERIKNRRINRYLKSVTVKEERKKQNKTARIFWLLALHRCASNEQ